MVIQKIERIIYVPTLTCNCNCAHCGQQQAILEPECDCGLVHQRIIESRSFDCGALSITGGEPFLKLGLPAMLADLCNLEKWDIDITTNGICTDAICSFCNAVTSIQDKRLLFSVSIDGMPEIHNRIRKNLYAFEHAVETLKFLENVGVSVKVNAVMQRENIGGLEKFAQFIAGECKGADISWIPEILEVNGRNEFPYTPSEITQILSRVKDDIGKVYLKTSGTAKIKDCHAGIKTCVISPSGKVYACLTGFSYKGIDSREDFYIGDLNKSSLDEIFSYCQDENAPFRKAVRECKGCWNPCEVGNEVNFWGMDIHEIQLNEDALKIHCDAERERYNVHQQKTGNTAMVVPGTTIPPDLVWGNIPAKPLRGRSEEGDSRMDEVKQEVNIEKIMEEIRGQIRREEEMPDIPAFEDIPLRGAETNAIAELPVDSTEAEKEKDWPFLIKSLRYLNNNYDIPYYWSFGPSSVKTFAKRVIRKLLKCLIAPILAMQNSFNAHAVRCLNQLRYFVEIILTRLDGDQRELEELRQQILTQNREMREMEERYQERLHAALGESRTAQEREMREIEERYQERLDAVLHESQVTQERERLILTEDIHAMREELAQLQENLQRVDDSLHQDMAVASGESAAHLDERYRELCQKIEILNRQSDAFSASVAKTILDYKRGNQMPLDKQSVQRADVLPSKADGDVYTAIDYFKFQNDFRGTRALISERQAMYLPYFRDCTEPVLDIGCGRGEFLRILKEQNIPAFGIDMYPEYVVEGELHGLDVRLGDGIAFLENADMRFGGIFAAQLIEHISFAELQKLCFTAYEKLVSGGYLILETPNPTCLAMFTSNFYLDPTHVKPVHPLLLAYVLREAGFSEVQTIYTEASHAGEALPLIDSDGIRNLEEVNRAIEQVSNLLYGSLDYAIMARK